MSLSKMEEYTGTRIGRYKCISQFIQHSPRSRHYNVYLIVEDKNGERDIDMVNITILNRDSHVEWSGQFLVSYRRKGPYGDFLYTYVLKGVTKPTVSANWSGTTEFAIVDIEQYIDYCEPSSETLILVNEDLSYNKIFENIEIEDDALAYMEIFCRRGYITDYKLEMDINY